MLAPCYLVHGGEPLQTEEIISSIKHLAVKAGYTNHVVFEINAQFNWEELLNKCQNLDLFAERSLLELRLHSDTISKQGSTVLEQVLQQQTDHNCILIRAPKLKAQILKSKWSQEIHKRGSVRAAKPIPAAKWQSWIEQRLKQANFTPSAEVCTYLARCYEGNLNAAVQCIDRLKSLLPSGSLELAQIKPFLIDSAHFSVFDLSSALLKGDAERTFNIINGLRNERIDPILVLWGVTREIRHLLQLKYELNKGTNLGQAAQNLGIWNENVPDLKLALDRLTVPRLERILHHAKAIDLTIKGLKQGNAWESLLAVCLMLATTKPLITEDLSL